MKEIKLLVLDVDGTLTDGKIFIAPTGECMKAFHVRDGYGITTILPRLGIEPVIITGRKSDIVKRRCQELNIREFYQGVHEKEKVLCEILEKRGYSWNQTAYMGDDLPDLESMKKCGIKACPADADERIKQICDFVSKCKGGEGAVREFINQLEEICTVRDEER